MTNTLYTGNNLDILPTLPDNSVDAIVTDPPYGLSFMGKKRDYDVPSQKLWEECLRVLKPGGYLLAFAGTRTQHRMAVRIEDAGFEIRDMIAWVYGSGFPKSLNIGKAVDKLEGNEREETDYIAPDGKKRWGGNSFSVGEEPNGRGINKATKGTSPREGRGTAMKPSLEPITVARKPLSEKTVAENVLKWGTGGINIDGCRVGTDLITAHGGGNNGEGRKYGGGQGIPTIEKGSNPHTGRFPANLIHDGSEEVVGLFPDTKSPKSYTRKSDGFNSNSYGKGMGENSGKESLNFGDSGSAARFFYQAKASKSERNMGCEELDKGCNHPTVKPIKLMEYLVKLVSREGATVLDPFAGSGSTLIACKRIDRQYIGIEMTEEYIPIIEARLNATVKEEPEEKQPSLF